ncbi:MAG: amino acid permease [Parcubacteria group bacterium Gr01-1014_30]|nr:MAG: amino acid permease [Parcubacteria group bacterium Gr01-1014_30]
MSKTKAVVYAVSTLSGTIIGVGLFGLPYVTLKVGFWVVLGYFAVLSVFAILVHSFFAELALQTPDFKRMPGFAKIYLGKWGQNTAYVTTVLGLLGALLAYLIVGGEFFTELLQPYFGGNNLAYTLLYFVAGSALIFHGIKSIAKIEFWGLILFFLILFAIFFRGQSFISLENLFPATDWSLFFLPYGVILFSIWGAALIPEVEEMLGEKKKMILKIVPVAVLIPIFVYLFFIYLILGITGYNTTESALGGLRMVLGDGVLALTLVFGLLTTFTSFIALGLTLKKVFWYDFGFGKNLSWAITCFLPFFLYLAGLKNFLPVIGVVGGVMLAFDGILILLMYNKIRPDKKFVVYPMILLFLAGIVYSFVYFS